MLARRIFRICLLLAALHLIGCDGGNDADRRSRGNVGERTVAPSVVATPRFAYVANAGSDSISVYTVDAATGQRRLKGTVAAAAGPGPVTVDPSGRFAYVTNSLADNISAFTINATTGALTSVGAAVGTGMTPQRVTVDPSGRFAYVANFSSNDVSAYTIDATTGALIPIGEVVAAGPIPSPSASTRPARSPT